MIVKLLTEHHLEFLSLKGGCRGSSESTLVKMSNCWKSHATAQYSYPLNVILLRIRMLVVSHIKKGAKYIKDHYSVKSSSNIEVYRLVKTIQNWQLKS